MSTKYDVLYSVVYFLLTITAAKAIILYGSGDKALINNTYTIICNATDEGDIGVVFFTRNGAPFGKLSYSGGQCNELMNGPSLPCRPNLCSCDGSGIYNWTIQRITEDWHNDKIVCYSVFGYTSNMHIVYVAVPFSNVVIEPNKAKEVVDGSFISFNCTTHPASRPTTNISWWLREDENVTKITTNISTRHNRPISNETVSTQSIMSFKPDRFPNKKSIFCIASADGIESVSSLNVTVIVIYPPTGDLKITSVPEGPLYINGSFVRFVCSIKGGNPVANLAMSCNFGNGTENITDISTDDDAVIESVLYVLNTGKDLNCNCVATHYIAAFKRSSLIEINFYVVPSAMPTIHAYPEEQVYLEGNIVTLTCEVQGGVPLASLSWQCKGEPVVENVTLVNINDTVESQLTLQMDSTFNDEDCVCLATHRDPSYKKSVVLNFTVLYPPTGILEINTSPPIVVEGKNVTTECSITGGNPIANISLMCGNIAGKNTDGLNKASSTVHIVMLMSNSSEAVCFCEGRHQYFPNSIKSRRYYINVIAPTESPILEEKTAKNKEEPSSNLYVYIGIGVAAVSVCGVIVVAIVLIIRRKRGELKPIASVMENEHSIEELPVTYDNEYSEFDQSSSSTMENTTSSPHGRNADEYLYDEPRTMGCSKKAVLSIENLHKPSENYYKVMQNIGKETKKKSTDKKEEIPYYEDVQVKRSDLVLDLKDSKSSDLVEYIQMSSPTTLQDKSHNKEASLRCNASKTDLDVGKSSEKMYANEKIKIDEREMEENLYDN